MERNDVIAMLHGLYSAGAISLAMRQLPKKKIIDGLQRLAKLLVQLRITMEKEAKVTGISTDPDDVRYLADSLWGKGRKTPKSEGK